MTKEKILILSLCTLSIVSASVLSIHNYRVKSDEIKLINYKESEKVNNDGFQIDKCDDVNAVAWLNENEVLTITNKSGIKHTTKYCSIYNVNTKKSTDFKDIDIERIYGVSKTGKYALYSEKKDIQKPSIKLLNLENGDTSDLNIRNKNIDAEYRWISDDKIFITYNNEDYKWHILDISGNIFAEGKFDFTGCYSLGAYIAGTEDIKDLGQTVEGKFYYGKWFKGDVKQGVYKKMFSMDVNTKQEEIVNGANGGIAEKRSNLILMSYCNNQGVEINGYYPYATYGFRIFDEDGNIIHTKESRLGIECAEVKLASDGSKVCYIETPLEFSGHFNEIVDSTLLKVMDVKSGEVKEIAKLNDFKESNLKDGQWMTFSNLAWDESGKSLLLTVEYCGKKTTPMINEQINTGETFDQEVIKNDTYIITFDN